MVGNKICYTDFKGQIHIESYPLLESPNKYIKRFVDRGFIDSFVIDIDELQYPEYLLAYDIKKEFNLEHAVSSESMFIHVLRLNLDKLKEIKKHQLREERIEEFKVMDILFIQGLSMNKDLTTIKSRQNYLRDIADIDYYETIEQVLNTKIEPFIIPEWADSKVIAPRRTLKQVLLRRQ